MKQTLNWTLCWSDTAEGEQSQRIPAVVPGFVQADWAAAHGIPSYLEGDHEEEYAWMEDKFWHYFTEIFVEDNGLVPFLCLDGVDYQYDLLLNGDKVLSHEGLFTRTRTDLSAYQGQTVEVQVRVYPAPKAPGAVNKRGMGWESAESCKPAFTYGWDWCPRLVTLGLADEAYVEYRPAVRISSLEVAYRLTDTDDAAVISLEYTLSGAGTVRVTVQDAAGHVAARKEFEGELQGKETLVLERPALWWPHNHGGQPIYTLKTELLADGVVTDSWKRRISFRRVRLVHNDGVKQDRHSWTELLQPMTFEINGRRIFVQGSNWVPPEMCRGSLKKDHIRTLLTLLKDANMNILRVWGGGYLHPDWFYDMCDEMGIMVWQEFPLACAMYSEKDSYLKVLNQEASSMVRQLRTHGCLALWCGGNELYFPVAGMSQQSKSLRLLNSVSLMLDPDTPYWPTTPQHGLRHGPYSASVQGKNYEHLSLVCDTNFLGYAEFGCGCVSDYDYIKTVLSPEELANPFESSNWEHRHGNHHLCGWALKTVTGYEGQVLKTIADLSDELQAACYQSLFEEMRRKWPHTSLALNWCFNEPWQTMAGNGLVHYPAIPRTSYYTVKNALRPRMLSLRFTKLGWAPGEDLPVQAYLLNDCREAAPAGTAVIRVEADGQLLGEWEWHFGCTAESSNQADPQIHCFTVPDAEEKRITLTISSREHPQWDSVYRLFVRP